MIKKRKSPTLIVTYEKSDFNFQSIKYFYKILLTNKYLLYIHIRGV